MTRYFKDFIENFKNATSFKITLILFLLLLIFSTTLCVYLLTIKLKALTEHINLLLGQITELRKTMKFQCHVINDLHYVFFKVVRGRLFSKNMLENFTREKGLEEWVYY